MYLPYASVKAGIPFVCVMTWCVPPEGAMISFQFITCLSTRKEWEIFCKQRYNFDRIAASSSSSSFRSIDYAEHSPSGWKLPDCNHISAVFFPCTGKLVTQLKLEKHYTFNYLHRDVQLELDGFSVNQQSKLLKTFKWNRYDISASIRCVQLICLRRGGSQKIEGGSEPKKKNGNKFCGFLCPTIVYLTVGSVCRKPHAIVTIFMMSTRFSPAHPVEWMHIMLLCSALFMPSNKRMTLKRRWQVERD